MAVSSTRSRAALGGFALVLMLAVAGCSTPSAAPEENDEPEPTQVTILLPANLGLNYSTPILAAEQFWPELGLDVTLESVDGGSVVAQQLIAGRSQFGILSISQVYMADVEGADLVGYSQITHDDVALLSVLEGSPIESIDDLEGASIGITSASDGAIAIVEALMTDAGIEDYEFNIVGDGGPASAAALQSGQIAAYAHGMSDVAGMVAAGLELRSIMPESHKGLPGNVLGMTRETYEDPELASIAEAITTGWHEAAAFIAENPEETEEVVCEVIPDRCTDPTIIPAILELVAANNAPLEGRGAGEIDLEMSQTLLDIVAPGHDLPLADVFPLGT